MYSPLSLGHLVQIGQQTYLVPQTMVRHAGHPAAVTAPAAAQLPVASQLIAAAAAASGGAAAAAAVGPTTTVVRPALIDPSVLQRVSSSPRPFTRAKLAIQDAVVATCIY